jgi:hypothetical protein
VTRKFLLAALISGALALPVAAQQGFYLSPVVSTESGGLFDAASETSTVIDLSLGSGSYSATFAVQAFASSGTTTCTYSVKGSIKDASASPSGTDFVDLPSPAALSCLAANDERLHFFRSRQIRTLRITLESLANGSGVTFAVFGMAK